MNEQTSLLDDRDLVTRSLMRIRFAYEVAQSNGLGPLYVCFSGGKDSTVLAELCRMAGESYGVEYELHYNITGIDPPEVVYFMRKHYPRLHWHQHEKSIFELIVEKKIPPTRIIRYCCAELKERGGTDRMCLTGVRWAESVKRRRCRPFEATGATRARAMLFNDNAEERRDFESCQMKRKLVCNPIIDWTDAQVWEWIRERGLPYCRLYDEGFSRIGCIGCPMAPTWEREKAFARWPKYQDAYLRAFARMLKNMPDADWKTGQEVFDWWMYDSGNRPAPGQLAFGELLESRSIEYD